MPVVPPIHYWVCSCVSLVADQSRLGTSVTLDWMSNTGVFFSGRRKRIFLWMMGVMHSNVNVKAICRSSEMQVLLNSLPIFLCYSEAVPDNRNIVDLHA